MLFQGGFLKGLSSNDRRAGVLVEALRNLEDESPATPAPLHPMRGFFTRAHTDYRDLEKRAANNSSSTRSGPTRPQKPPTKAPKTQSTKDPKKKKRRLWDFGLLDMQTAEAGGRRRL